MADDLQYSAGGIVLHEGRLLLIEARRTCRWQLPKGHLERGETPLQAAVREIREETGAAVIVLERAGEIEYRFRIPSGRWIFKHVDFFLCEFAGQASDRCDTREVKRAAWHRWDRALALLAFPNERHLVRSSLRRCRRSQRLAGLGLSALATCPSDAAGAEAAGAGLGCSSSVGRAYGGLRASSRGDIDGPEEIP